MSPEFKVVAGMALLRMISAGIEVTAALLMLRIGRVESAFQINAALGLVGPLILIGVTALGVFGMATKMSYSKIALIAIGVAIIIYAARK